MHRILERQLRKLGISSGPPTAEQWTRFLERVDRAYTEADQDRYTLERALDLSSAEMRKRFAELRSAQGQLVLASRKAGMADVATSVLHNVGNVLNSVNVSAGILVDGVKKSARAGLGKSLALLAAQPKPGAFLDTDPRGQKLLPYLSAVDHALGEEQVTMVRELELLSKNIEHIKSIVSAQLSAARGDNRGRVAEQVALQELLDDALTVLGSGASPDQLEFVREYQPVVIDTDRHKLFQIVMNLLANARDAVRGRGGRGVIAVRAKRTDDGRVAIEVQDDGVGIAKDDQGRIFNHGFTTKREGHGFGLHSSACAAMELGGRLTVHSDGVGHGARFTLVLPRTRTTSKTNMPRVSLPVHVGDTT